MPSNTAPVRPAPASRAHYGDGLPPGPRRRSVFVILLGLTLVVLDSSIVTLALPRIARTFETSASAAVWLVTGYQLAVLGLILPMASLGERLDYRRVYLWGMAVFAAASLLCTLAQNLWQLVACRVLVGAAGAAIMGVSPAIVRLTYPAALLGRGFALNATTVAIAAVTGPTLAALILSALDWPWLFALSAPLAALTLWQGRRHLPSRPPPTTPPPLAALDWLLNIATFALLFWGLDRLVAHGLGQGRLTDEGWQALAALALGLTLGAWYVRRQWHLPAPLLPLDLLRIPVFALSMCASISAFSAQMLAMIALPFLSMSILHHPPLWTGLLVSIWPISIALIAPLAGRLVGRWPGSLLGATGMLMLATGMTALAWMPLYASPWWMGAALALSGAGFGLFQTPNNHIILTSGPPERSGAAGGMQGTARLTGQSLGSALAAGVFAFLPPPHVLQGPQTAFAIAAACALLAACASALRKRSQR
ncbi:MFS transporter [Allofranklinella schreckenbergeri]|uniref:MFS transporter n=1 Tax=Allofranklinella schreckenbergeri TaxID=1076744 RepID=A0A3M6QC09_9BURK|nr:MFS transporter [Allofranklinella schreckenbergeri]RMW99948.1 MFS transporter [Allofranklinella schreckenbergeri]